MSWDNKRQAHEWIEGLMEDAMKPIRTLFGSQEEIESYKNGHEDGVAAEREKIAKWLETFTEGDEYHEWICALATRIRNGEHDK